MRRCTTYTQCTQYVIHIYIYIYTYVHHMYYKCSIDTCIVCGPRMSAGQVAQHAPSCAPCAGILDLVVVLVVILLVSSAQY